MSLSVILQHIAEERGIRNSSVAIHFSNFREKQIYVVCVWSKGSEVHFNVLKRELDYDRTLKKTSTFRFDNIMKLYTIFSLF